MTGLSLPEKNSMEDRSREHPRPQTRTLLQEFVAGPHFGDMSGRMNGAPCTRISVVMPAYNQAHFIERSILSVLNQNYPNLQFIIMDGGSTDGTVEILRRYEKRLIWRSESDRGQSDAINKALQLADGEIVGWLNSDDVYFPGALHRIHQVAAKRPRAVMYSGSVAIIDRDDLIVNVTKGTRPSARRLLYEGLSMSSQGVFWRRARQPAGRQYNPDLHHALDVDFWLKLLANGYAEFVPELIGGFRVYEGTKTSATGERGLTELNAIRKEYGVDDQTLRWQLMRTGLRFSRLLRWVLLTRHHCKIMNPQSAPQPFRGPG